MAVSEWDWSGLTMTILNLKISAKLLSFPPIPSGSPETGSKPNSSSAAKISAMKSSICSIKQNEMEFQHLVHEPTPTSRRFGPRPRHTAGRRGQIVHPPREKHARRIIQFNIPSHLKLDMKVSLKRWVKNANSKILQSSKSVLDSPSAEFPPSASCSISIHYFDERIPSYERSAFNCGMPTESIIMKSKDLIALVQPKFGRFGKE